MKKYQNKIITGSIILFIAILIVTILTINIKSDVTKIAKIEKDVPKQSTNATVGAESELSKFAYDINGTNIHLKHYTGTSTNLTIYSKYTKGGTQYNTVIDKDYSSFVYGSSNLTNVIIQDGVSIRNTIIETFKDCTTLETATIGNINTTSLNGMFKGCTNLKSVDFSNCNTSNITNMENLFYECKSLTSINIGNFDTRNVTTMARMFYYCSSLTSINVSNFNTSNVTNMGGMFSRCSNLTSINVSSFNTSNVTNMNGMFNECSSLTSINVSNFDTRNVTNIGSMFKDCRGLTSLNLSNFDTRSVTDMWNMFSGCTALTNLNIGSFNTGNVTNMKSVFKDCSSLTSLDLSNFDTRNVTDMYEMFSGCSSLTSLDVSGFNTENVTNMKDLFCGCSGLTELDLDRWNTRNVTNMQRMFVGCSSLQELDLSNFNTSKVTDIWSMFNGCKKITNLNLSGWDISKVTNSEYFLSSCDELAVINLSGWDMSNLNNSFYLGSSKITEVYTPSKGTIYVSNWYYNESNINDDNGYRGDIDMSVFGNKSVHLVKSNNNITYYTNGGTGTTQVQVKKPNIASIIRNNTFTGPNNKEFIGWNTTTNGKGTSYAPGDNYTTDSRLTLYAQWEKDEYTVTLNTNGGTINSGDITNYTYGEGATLPSDVTKEGYVFKGWYKEEDFSGTQVTAIGIAETGDKIYYAKWLVDTDKDGIPDEEDPETLVNYTVEYYKQNLTKTGYDEPQRETKKGNLGSTVIIEEKEYTGFIVNEEIEGTVKEGTVVVDGSLVLKLYYDRETYQITYVVNEGTINDTNYIESYTYGIGGTLPSNVRKEGYVFRGWYESSDLRGEAITAITAEETGAKTYYAKWLVDTDGDGIPDEEDTETLVNYTIEHYKQNLVKTGYDEPERETKQGNLGSTVIAGAKTYTGFRQNIAHEERVASGTVVADGSLVLKLYYDRETYQITYIVNEGTINEENYIQNYTYGIGGKLPSDVTKQGYTFRGWYENSDLRGEEKTVITAEETGAKTYYASWTADGNTTYKVEHYKENLAQSGYDLAETENKEGITGENVTAVAKEYEGFVENRTASERIEEGIVKADGTLTLKLYYNREIYDITYVVNEGAIVDTNYATQYKYEIGATLPSNVIKEGYVFAGWYENEELTGEAIEAIDVEETGAKTYYAKWTTKKDVPYTVKHYKQIGITNQYELADTENLTDEIGKIVTAVAKQYEGYIENTTTLERVPSGTITADGKLELKLFYDTIKHSVVFKDGDEIVETQIVEDKKSAVAPSLIKEGYTLSWDKSFEEVTSDLEVNAIWTKVAEKIYKYKIEHYVQTKEGYELKEVEEFQGTIGQTVEATPKEYEAYVFDEENQNNVTTGIITENDELVLKLMYTTKKVTVIIKDGDIIIDTQIIDYGTTPNLPDLTKPGYILNWKKEDNQTGEIIYKAVWTKDPNYKDPNASNSNNIVNDIPQTPNKLPQTGQNSLTIGAIVGLLGMCVTYFTKYKF